MDTVLGIDVGTSGVRAVALTRDLHCVALSGVGMPAPGRAGACVSQPAQAWADAFDACLDSLHQRIEPGSVRAVAIDGTSGTVLVTDGRGVPLGDALMYNDASGTQAAARIAAVAPPESAAQGAASGLARALTLLDRADARRTHHVLHQSDWLVGRLLGRFGDSDENSALKTGYDPVRHEWPRWLEALGLRRTLLPHVHEPGTVIGTVGPAARARHGWVSATLIAAGTTDGVAAFLATGASQVGDAVTSLGSTLVVKLLSNAPLQAPEYGLYSHRLGNLWLPGGASNAGGAALLQHFSAARMAELTPLLRPDEPTGLDYYPLPGPGERFPIRDAQLPSRVTPRPADDARFFQGLLEGLAGIEQLAYARLRELGAPALRSVRSVGGGAANAAWTRIRARRLGVPMQDPLHAEAAFGTARLAARAAWGHAL